MAEIQLRGVSKRWGSFVGVEDFNLTKWLAQEAARDKLIIFLRNKQGVFGLLLVVAFFASAKRRNHWDQVIVKKRFQNAWINLAGGANQPKRRICLGAEHQIAVFA